MRTVQILSISLLSTLFFWGIWTMFTWLGIPMHGAVLLPSETMDSLSTLCTSGGLLCRGAYTLAPFIGHTLTRIPFLVWYVVACAGIAVALMCWQYLRVQRWELSLRFTPWSFLLFFIGLLWILFTSLGLSDNGSLPFRTIIEPHPEIYKGAGQEAIEELTVNYNALKDRGCLTRIGTFSGVAEASSISMTCLQQTFITRVLPPLLVVLVLVMEFLVLGRFFLRKLLPIQDDSWKEAIYSVGLGACGWIVLLWFGAVFSVYTAVYGWMLLIAVPIVLYRDSVYWLRKSVSERWTVGGQGAWIPVFLGWFLFSYIALNYLSVVRPFPIGWDDLGSYLNRPRLLVSYGHFIHSMSPFQWEYLTSLGFLLFGFSSVFGATVSLMINWFAGILAILSILLFGHTFLGKGKGLIAATVYYTLPLVGHFSFADMKIDNAVFAAAALAFCALFTALFFDHPSQQYRYRWIALAGIFSAFCFAFKATGIMVFMALGAILLGVGLHWLAFIASLFFVILVYLQQGALRLDAILVRLNYAPDAISVPVASAIVFCIGFILLGVAGFLGKRRLSQAAISVAVFLVSFVAAIFPWIEHNTLLSGAVLPRLALSAPDTLTPDVDIFGTHGEQTPYSLPPELSVDRHHEYCTPSGAEEELGRYWGDLKGWRHYITLPWRTVMNIDHAGYYVTTQFALLFFPLLLLLPFFWRASSSWLRWLWIGTALLLVQWIFLANGVPWYGIGMFLGLSVALEVLLLRSPDIFSRWTASFFLVVALLTCLGMRFWQFESQRNMFEYALGKVNAASMRERTIPYYDDITDIALQRNETMPDRPFLYRIGTFIPYFVPKNLEIIPLADHQLDTFNCLYQDRDPVKMVQRLKALGFNSIIFDTNTATIEKDPNGSLHQKVNALTQFLNSPESGLQVVINDSGAGVAYLLIP